MAVSVCIDLQVKGMPTRASWSGTDGVEQTLWYGEASHMASECSLFVLNLQDNGPGRGFRARRYSDQVLRPHVVPFSTQHPWYLSSRITHRDHSAFLIPNFLQANGFHVLDRPALSPDLALIEHLWDELWRRIHSRRRQPTNVNELQAALRQKWNIMRQAFINRLVNSMRRRECWRRAYPIFGVSNIWQFLHTKTVVYWLRQ